MVVVVGANGLIGRAVLQTLRSAGCECEGTSSRADVAAREGLLWIDALDPDTWRNLPAKIGATLICAARPGLVDCRRHPRETRALNVEAVAALATECSARGAFVVVPSTSCVFDGSRPDFGPGEPVCPPCEYGKQKAELERLLPMDAAIVRLTKVLTAENPLLQSWLAKWSAGRPVTAAADARISLLQLGEVARLLSRLLQQPVSGLWQLSASDDISWSDLAVALAKSADDHVRAVPLRQIDPEAEFTPAFGTLEWAWPFEGDHLSSCASSLNHLARNPAQPS
jgi:dTDP-4-dehydrorhamnose reductase